MSETTMTNDELVTAIAAADEFCRKWGSVHAERAHWQLHLAALLATQRERAAAAQRDSKHD